MTFGGCGGHLVMWSLDNDVTFGCNCNMEIIRKGNFYAECNLRSGVPFVFVGAGKERLIQLLDHSSAAP